MVAAKIKLKTHLIFFSKKLVCLSKAKINVKDLIHLFLFEIIKNCERAILKRDNVVVNVIIPFINQNSVTLNWFENKTKIFFLTSVVGELQY